MKRSATLAAVVVALGAMSSAAACAQHGDHLMVAPSEMKWADVPSLPPGAKVAVLEGPSTESKPFTMRIRLPANYTIPAHYHSTIEHVTVLTGTFYMGIGDKFDAANGRPLPAGGVAIMQPATRHFAWTREATEIQVHGVGPWTITYVDPADDPRRKSQ